MLPKRGPYKVAKVFKESNTVQVKITPDQRQIVNLKNVRRFYSRPEWMKDNHTEPMEEEPETPTETVDHMDKEEGTVTNKQPVPLEELTEIFEGLTSNNLVSLANVEDLESLTTGVAVEILWSGE
jgi:hypothetical protein